ncbi:MAG: type II toxin-antitoxin system HicB family antitoxin [Chloroflexi bacterium]|nr:type II toxin-antitoxin system HicB family antitoxin [Chloroflexota bacterium]
MMEYGGYRARVIFDDEAELFHGEVIGTRDVITFQGTSVPELRDAFAASVDEYLQVCAERGRVPDKAYSGRIPLRIRPDLHRAATETAQSEGKSLNAWLAEAVEKAVHSLSASGN